MASEADDISESIATHNPAMDGEHRAQVDLINALCQAVERNAAHQEVGAILERLLDYSRAHFMSEELFMRLDSYAGYDEHVADHTQMVEALEGMMEGHRSGQPGLIAATARQMLSFLVRHIQTKDRVYANSARM